MRVLFVRKAHFDASLILCAERKHAVACRDNFVRDTPPSVGVQRRFLPLTIIFSACM